MFLNEIISAVLQVILFTLIPFVFFLFRKDKNVSFLRYMGLYKAGGRAMLFVLLSALLFVLIGVGVIYFDEGIRETVLSPNSVTGKLRLMGLNTTTVLTLLVVALFKTSLSEEIFFRGFIAKRLINELGLSLGNLLQALFFGLVHFALFWFRTETTLLSLIFFFDIFIHRRLDNRVCSGKICQWEYYPGLAGAWYRECFVILHYCVCDLKTPT